MYEECKDDDATYMKMISSIGKKFKLFVRFIDHRLVGT